MLTSLLSFKKKKKNLGHSLSLSNLNVHYSSSSFPYNLSKLHHTAAKIIFLTSEFPRVGEDLERERERERERSSYKILILPSATLTLELETMFMANLLLSQSQTWLWSSHGKVNALMLTWINSPHAVM